MSCNVLVELLTSSFLQEDLEQMCLLPCHLLEGDLEGCWGLVSVHTCLAFSVVDAVNSIDRKSVV